MESNCISVARPFAKIAMEFTELIERLPELSRDDLMLGSLQILPRLFTAALNLKYTEEGEPDVLPEPQQKMGLLVEALGGIESYYSVFSPYNDKPALDPAVDRADICLRSLADDLADIYWDIKPGVEAFFSEDTLSQHHAVAYWYFGFIGGDHTARHLLSALPPLYAQSIGLLG